MVKTPLKMPPMMMNGIVRTGRASRPASPHGAIPAKAGV